MAAAGRGIPDILEANMVDLLWNLNLTAKKGDVAEFSHEEDDGGSSNVEWALMGTVLSPTTLRATLNPQSIGR